jgi:hypothetical protein
VGINGTRKPFPSTGRRQRHSALQEMVAGVKQTGGGQVARVSELSSREYENSSSTERGIYVCNGYMIFATRHYKVKRSTNREFNVVRFLLCEVDMLCISILSTFDCS